ncbi:MAG: hypothetical protein V4463_18395 [Pseudomonadota bacterium]
MAQGRDYFSAKVMSMLRCMLCIGLAWLISYGMTLLTPWFTPLQDFGLLMLAVFGSVAWSAKIDPVLLGDVPYTISLREKHVGACLAGLAWGALSSLSLGSAIIGAVLLIPVLMLLPRAFVDKVLLAFVLGAVALHIPMLKVVQSLGIQ